MTFCLWRCFLLLPAITQNEENPQNGKTEGKSDLCQWGPSYMHQFTFDLCLPECHIYGIWHNAHLWSMLGTQIKIGLSADIYCFLLVRFARCTNNVGKPDNQPCKSPKSKIKKKKNLPLMKKTVFKLKCHSALWRKPLRNLELRILPK